MFAESFALQNLRLNQTIPVELGSLVNTGTFYSRKYRAPVTCWTMNNPMLMICFVYGSVVWVYLQNNTLTGTIPSEFGRLAKLSKWLHVIIASAA